MVAITLLLVVSLGLGLGVLILPNVDRARWSLLGLALALSWVLVIGQAPLLAWALLTTAAALGLGLSVAPARLTLGGWHNWLVILVAGSCLWLLSLFLLWTVEEAFSFPVAVMSTTPLAADVLAWMGDRFLWMAVFGALLLLTVIVGISAWVPPTAEEPRDA